MGIMYSSRPSHFGRRYHGGIRDICSKDDNKRDSHLLDEHKYGFGIPLLADADMFRSGYAKSTIYEPTLLDMEDYRLGVDSRYCKTYLKAKNGATLLQEDFKDGGHGIDTL